MLGFLAAIACAATALVSGLGYRVGWWHYSTGLGTIAYVFWVAAAVAIVCAITVGLTVIGGGARSALVFSLTGLAIAGATAWVPYDLRMTANALPRIHDISTDLADPPQFVRVATLRSPTENPVAYDGPETAALQREAYPDIATLVFSASRDSVMAAAQTVLTSMGLALVEIDPMQGRIEATATSRLFGFKDDMVVRITDDAAGTRVDVRSKSRVGRHDFGMNAKRIREFSSRLQAAVG
jgi:uncharacterized protein (DUF1499 family)